MSHLLFHLKVLFWAFSCFKIKLNQITKKSPTPISKFNMITTIDTTTVTANVTTTLTLH